MNKQSKLPLIIGSIILLTLIIIMIFPEVFAIKSPYTVQQLRFSTENGSLDIKAAPYPPSEGFPLGSDDLGRDILSYIIYGTRLTILLAILTALLQFVLSIPMALLAGFGNEFSKSVIKQLSVMFSAIPALLISVIILKLDFFVGLQKQFSILAFVLVLTLVGWPKLGLLLMERVETINKQAFIKGAVAIGKNRRQIALSNVVPHLAPEIIVLFFMEIARNLSMIMQLGVFGVFVGNLKIIKDSQNGVLTYYNVSFEPEWASMLATSRTYISVAPWAVLFPAFAFFISVLGFNLFGEGLRNLLQDKDSMIIPRVRNLLTLEWRHSISLSNIKKVRVPLPKILMIMTLVLIYIISTFNNKYDINKQEYSMLKDQPILIGTNDRDQVVQTIISRMEDLNIEPLKDKYVFEYETQESYILEYQEMIFESDEETYSISTDDYQTLSWSDKTVKGRIIDVSKDDLFNIEDYSMFADKFIMFDQQLLSQQLIGFFVEDITTNVSIAGVLLINNNNNLEHNSIVEESSYPVIAIKSDLVDSFKLDNDVTITFSSRARELGSIGKNILGIVKGSDKYISEEAILIGLNYNHLNNSDVLKFNLDLMATLSELTINKRSLIFMFVDGTTSQAHNGIVHIAEDFPYSSQKIKAYIDLTGLTSLTYDSIEYSAKQAPITRQFAWSVGHHLLNEFIQEDIRVNELETLFIDSEYYFTKDITDNTMFWERGLASIIISNDGDLKGKHDLYELGRVIVEVINLNNY